MEAAAEGADDDAAARAEAIEYWCGLSFVHETSDGPSDETNLLAMRKKYSAGAAPVHGGIIWRCHGCPPLVSGTAVGCPGFEEGRFRALEGSGGPPGCWLERRNA